MIPDNVLELNKVTSDIISSEGIVRLLEDKIKRINDRQPFEAEVKIQVGDKCRSFPLKYNLNKEELSILLNRVLVEKKGKLEQLLEQYKQINK